LARLGGSTIGPHEFLHEVSMLIHQVVPNLAPRWATLDPDTMLPSGALETDMSQDLVRALSRNAILDDDVNGVAALARRRIPIGTLSELPPAVLAGSRRVQLIHGPAGIGDELRLLLRADGATWGEGVLYRPTGERPFTPQEQAFLAAIIGEVTAGLRTRLSQRPSNGSGFLVPGVVTLDADQRLLGTTQGAAATVALMPGDAHTTLQAIALAATRYERASARVRLSDGRWSLLQGAKVHSPAAPRAGPEPTSAPSLGDAEVAVSLMEAPRSTMEPILLRLHSLSRREREVARLLLRGRHTGEIAGALHISPHTLRDHVKAVFNKVGVRHRAELMALAAAYVTPE
jgi:DNA-binding CsgD family transcriptional regulator